MQVRVGDAALELVQGDIIIERVDAIVNAANSRLAGGGGDHRRRTSYVAGGQGR